MDAKDASSETGAARDSSSNVSAGNDITHPLTPPAEDDGEPQATHMSAKEKLMRKGTPFREPAPLTFDGRPEQLSPTVSQVTTSSGYNTESRRPPRTLNGQKLSERRPRSAVRRSDKPIVQGMDSRVRPASSYSASPMPRFASPIPPQMHLHYASPQHLSRDPSMNRDQSSFTPTIPYSDAVVDTPYHLEPVMPVRPWSPDRTQPLQQLHESGQNHPGPRFGNPQMMPGDDRFPGFPPMSNYPSFQNGNPSLPPFAPSVASHQRPSSAGSYAPSGLTAPAPPSGYELLAAKLSGEYEGAPIPGIYRRYGALNHRLLLHMQDELAELEEQLHALDMQDTDARRLPGGIMPASRRQESAASKETYALKQDILGKIGFKMCAYSKYTLMSFKL